MLKSKKNYQNILTKIADAVFLTDRTGALIFVSSHAAKIFGYTVREMLKIGQISHLLGNNLFDERQLEINGLIENVEREILDKSGKKHTLLVNVKRGSIVEKKETVLYSCREITSIKSNEKVWWEIEEFSQFFENAPIGTVIISAATYQFIKVNAVFCEMLGYSEAELMRLSWREVTHPEDLEKDWQSIAQGEPRENFRHPREKRLLKKDKTLIGAKITLTGIRDKKGEILYAWGMVEEIAECKQTEEKLRQYRADAIASPQAKPKTADQEPTPTPTRNPSWHDLEQLVQVRTAELATANQQLQQEIRDRAIAQIALYQKTAQLQAILNNTVEGFALIDPNFCIRAFNQPLFGAIAQLFGKKMRQGTSILEYILEENREDFSLAFARSLQGEQIRGERKITDSLWIEYHLIPVRDRRDKITAVSFSQVDITDRVRAQAALRASNESLRALVEAAPLPMITLDPNGIVLNWNRAAELLFGWTEAEVLGRPNPLIPAENWQDSDSFYPRSLTGERFTEVEVRRQKKDGTWIDVAISSAPLVRDSQGNVAATVRVLADITERKRAETALIESEEKNRALLIAIPDALFRIRRDGIYLDFIPAADSQPLTAPNQFLGKNVTEVLPKTVAMQLLGAVEQVLQNRHIQVVEFQMRIQGHFRDYEARVAAIGNDDVLSIVRDMTARKQAERALRQQMGWTELILQTTMDGFFAVNASGRIQETNPAFCKIVGYLRSQLLGMNLSELEAIATPEETAKQIEAVMQTGSARFETKYRRQDGQIIDVEASITCTEIGRDKFLFAFVRDITERKKEQKELQLFKAIIETSNEAIAIGNPDGQIVYVNSAHEKLFGRSLAEARQLKYGDYYSPESREIFERIVAAALNRGEGWEGELDVLDGTYRLFPVWQRSDSILNAEGNVIFFFSLMHDISDRKQVEADLKLQAQIIDQIHDAVICTDLNGFITSWNRGAERLYGYAAEEAISQKISFIYPPDSEEFLQQKVLRPLHEKSSHEIEMRNLAKSGEEIWIQLFLSRLLDKAGQASGTIGYSIDISDRKRAEEALRESQHFIQKVADTAPLILYVYDCIEQRYVYTNRQIIEILGLAPEQLLAMGSQFMRQILHPDDLALIPILNKRWETAKDGDVLGREIRMRHASGEWRYFQCQETLFARTPDGHPKQILGAAEDITERKAAEEERDRFFNLSLDILAIVGLDGYFKRVNPAITTILGYTIEEFLSTPVLEFIHPDDRLGTEREILQKLKTGEPTRDFESRYRCKDGSYKWLAWSALPVPEEGLTYAVARDNTERKSAEIDLRESREKYRVLFDIFPLGITLVDEEGNLIDVNPASEKILGISREEHLKRKPDRQEWQFVRADGSLLTEDFSIAKALTNHQIIENQEVGIVKPNGEICWLSVTVAPVPLEGYGVAIAYIDITDRKQAESELRQREREFRTLAENTRDTIARLDKQLRHVYVNPAIEELTGLSPQTFIGKTYRELGFPDEQRVESWEKVMRKVIETGREAAMEFELPLTTSTSYQSENLPNSKQPVSRHDGEIILQNSSLLIEGSKVRIQESQLTIKKSEARIQKLELAGLKPPNWELLKSPPSKFRYYQTRIVPELAADGGVEFILCTTREITEGKKMEESLRMARARLHHLLAASPAVIYSCKTEEDFRTTFMGDNVTTILGYEAREFIKDTHFWTSRLHPEDADRVVAQMQRVVEIGDDTYEYRFQHKNGSYRWMYDQVHLVRDADGNPLEIIGSWIDITERKRAEEQLIRFSQAVASASDGIGVTDMAGQSIHHNQAFFLMFGYTPEELNTAGGSRVLFVDRAVAMEVFETIVSGGSWSGEVQMHSREGNVLDILLRAYAIKDNANQLIGLVSLCTDISDRKRIQEELAQRAAELARSNAELEQFAYVASHDLQEPLRMVASYTQLLARRYAGQIDANAEKYISYAVDGATRMQQLIQDLLQYSRVGRKAKELAPVDCGTALKTALANLQMAIRESSARIHVTELPVVRGDDTQLVQLFQNLIGNAIKYRGERSPLKVQISAQRQEGAWLFCVEDNGIGLDPKHAERIFLIFQRLHTREEYPGTGIGLAICKKIVERHGGQIWVESQLSQGATFYFTIPDSEEASS